MFQNNLHTERKREKQREINISLPVLSSFLYREIIIYSKNVYYGQAAPARLFDRIACIPIKFSESSEKDQSVEDTVMIGQRSLRHPRVEHV